MPLPWFLQLLLSKMPGKVGKGHQEKLLQAIGDAGGGAIGIYTVGDILVLLQQVHGSEFQFGLLTHKPVGGKSIPENGRLFQVGIVHPVGRAAETEVCRVVKHQAKPRGIAPVFK